MRMREGDKRYVVERESGSGPSFELRREDTARVKARIESRAHPRVKFVVRALYLKNRPVTYEARQGHGHPTQK